MRIHTHTHTNTLTYIHICIYTIHVDIYMQRSEWFQFYTHACMHACVHVCMYVRTYVCMYVCICMYIVVVSLPVWAVSLAPPRQPATHEGGRVDFIWPPPPANHPHTKMGRGRTQSTTKLPKQHKSYENLYKSIYTHPKNYKSIEI